jgi:4-amino-4-deoxy-L-arabinose transferase-like glycosyltransferase
VLFALALRLIVLGALLSQLSTHTINYNDFGWESWEVGWTARSIFLGRGFSSPFLPFTGPTALVPPLYTYLLAGTFKIFGLNTIHSAITILGFNSLCSSLTCVTIYYITRNALTDRAGRIAAFAWAIYPFAIYFSASRVWDYALTALLFSCCLLFAQTLWRRGRWGWAGFGALFGVAALCNPCVVSMMPFLVVIAAGQYWRRSSEAPRQRAKAIGFRAMVATLAFLAVCTPWTIRNMRVMHSFFFIRDGFALEAYAGNNGDTHESNSAWAHPASNPVEMQKYEREGEIRYMAEKHNLFVSFVKAHPGFFVVATARRIVRFWTGYWSFSPEYLKYEPFDLPNVPFCLFLLWATIRGVRRWMRDNWRSAVPYLIALVVFPLPYYITHSSMEYRQPLEPILIIMVSVGLFGTGLARVEAPEAVRVFEEEDGISDSAAVMA